MSGVGSAASISPSFGCTSDKSQLSLVEVRSFLYDHVSEINANKSGSPCIKLLLPL